MSELRFPSSQASSLRLEQGVKELESQLRQAYTHMENGEPPDDKAQVEWEKMVQDENRRKQRLLEKMNVSTPLAMRHYYPFS